MSGRARTHEVPEALVAGHISLDVYPTLHGPVTLEPGRLVVVGPALMSTGGAVANTGVALHRIGVRVRLVARIGADFFGRALLELLTEQGRHLADDLISSNEPTSYTIVVSPPGVDRSFLHCPGANEAFSEHDVPYALLAGVRIFHFGYPPLMPSMCAAGGAQLERMFESVRDQGAATSLDLCVPDPNSDAGQLDWQEVLARVLPHVDVFAPSIDELLFIFDRAAHERLAAGAALASIVDHSQLAELGELLADMGAAVVAIKLGDQGLYLRTTQDHGRAAEFCDRLGLEAAAWRDREVLSPCFAPRAIAGTTGTGDATIAGLLAALLRGLGPAQAATIATAVGACSVEQPDPTSGIPGWEDVARRLAEGWPRLPLDVTLRRDSAIVPDSTGTMLVRG